AEFQEGDGDREAKRENAKERQRRARERRKSLFEQLRARGIIPPWDTATGELERMLSRETSRPVTPPVTRDNTATHTPDTSITEPKGSGAGAPADPIFGTGLAFLIRKGIPADKARPFLGKLRKQAGDVQAAAILADA